MKTKTLLLRRALFLCAFLLGIVGEILADGGVGYKGLRINVNGIQTWYNVHGVSWSYQGCGNFGSTFYNSGASNWSSTHLGTFSSNSTFQITGYAVVGWVNNGDYLAGRLEYKIWKNTESEPGSWSLLNIGNYESPTSGASQVVCTLNNDRIVGYDNGTTNIMPTSVGTYNFKVRALGRIQYTGGGGGFFNENNGTDLTATFEVYDPYTIADGDWNTSSTWHNGSLPSSNIPVIINNNITINSSVTNQPASVTINSAKSITFGASGVLTATSITNNGSIVMTSGGTLTIAAGGTMTNNATFTAGTGTVFITNAGTVNGSGPITFNNLTIDDGTLTLTTVPTINGTLQINNGNLSAAPIYTSNSTLLYNTTYIRFNEWSATGIGTIGTTPGYPNNVTINSGTFTVLNGDAGTARAINGTLTIAIGATFATGPLNALFTVGGNIVNNGTLAMSTTTGRIKCANFTNNAGSTLTLSSNNGGDLEVTGHLTENGNINSSSRAVFFTGTGIQDVQGTSPFSVDYIVLNKASGSVRMLCDLLCEGPNGGNAMTLTGSTDVLDLNSYTLTIGKAGISSGLSGSGYLKTSSSSSLSILGTGDFGSINFDPTSNTIGSITLNRTSINAGATLVGNLTATTINITSGTLTLAANKQLTLTGALTNNGTITIESGATLVQGSNSTLSGNGTYNVKQDITGTNNGSAPNGRFWYLGSPVSLATSSVYFGNASNIVKKRDEATNGWITVASGTPENLVVGKGYYTQAMGNSTITFTGGLVNNGAITINGLSRTAGQFYEGFNLVSNPYPSYLDWDAVTKTDVGNTMWYRTASGSTAGSMVFDTYVAGTGGIGTNLNGAGVSNLIPPMQSFWVRVNSGSTTGSLGLTNSMRAHFTSINGSVAGLKSTSNERDLFLRMNLLQANKKDQLIVYVNETATNGFDVLDGEKMMQAGLPQFYTSAAGKKITINGLNSAKKQQALPITMELPTTGVHSFVIEDLEIDNGLVWLEDKQEEIMQALEPGTVYEFYANSGINADRFVLHFQLIDNTTPINVYNEVNSSANFIGKGASVHAETAGVVVIKLPATTEGVTDIQIRDAAGKLVYTGSTNTLETSVQFAQANGIYYVTLNSASGVEVRKVFIQQ